MKNRKLDASDRSRERVCMVSENKELKENCLVDQVYVKAEDGNESVAKYVESVAKENNAKIKIVKVVRFETGEGMAKKEENFAEEVAKQMGM